MVDIIESVTINMVLEEVAYIKDLFDQAPTGTSELVDRLRTKAIKRLQRYLKRLHGTDFTAALDIIKETFGRRAYEVSGYANF